MSILRLLRFSPVRTALFAFARSRTARRSLRAVVRVVGRRRILRIAWKAMRL